MTLERFSQRAKTALVLARIATKHFGHSQIESHHLLLGLFQEKNGVAGHSLRQLGVNQADLQDKIRSLTLLTSVSTTSIHIAPSAKRSLELAVDSARRVRYQALGTGHLLIGILRQQEDILLEILKVIGLEPKTFEEHVNEEIRNNTDRFDYVEQFTLSEAVKESILNLFKREFLTSAEENRNRITENSASESSDDGYRLELIGTLEDLIKLEPYNVDLETFLGKLRQHKTD